MRFLYDRMVQNSIYVPWNSPYMIHLKEKFIHDESGYDYFLSETK